MLVLLGQTEVADLQNMARWVDQEVLRLDVPVDHSLLMDVSESSEQLVSVEFKQNWVDRLVQSVEHVVNSEHCHWDVVHHNIQHTVTQ